MSLRFPSTRTPDVVVIGAGLIGLTIALELSDRGAEVTVIDRGRSLEGASAAAAGMLAAEDIGNPPGLRSLSRLSIERYPAFLERIQSLSGIGVPYQTDTTVQYLEDDSTIRLAEHSLDPRQLAAALHFALKATSVQLLEGAQIASILQEPGGASVQLSGGPAIHPQAVIFAAGAWTSAVMTALGEDALPITPRKGQMLRVRLPIPLHEVHRSEHIYIVPRTYGAHAGTALVGASVEDAGFDTSVQSEALASLRALAAELLPQLASEENAPVVEAWAGLRPATPDGLPLLGATSRANHFIASGHYRNGILLAPGTAVVMADLVEGKTSAIDLANLSPQRFALSTIY